MVDVGVQIGTILLRDTEGEVPPDAFGTRWKLTGLDGWFDGWESTTASTEQRSQADGAHVGLQYAGPRVIHVKGSAEDTSWDGVTRAWDRLLAQIPFRPLGPITVSTGDGTVPQMSALVRQHERAILSERYPTWAKFSLSLMAPDPRRYATTTQSVNLVLPFASGGLSFPLTFPISFPVSTTISQATATNDGNVTTFPILTITGPCPPARIINLTTNEVIRVVNPVLAGQTLVIDVAAGTATNGGQPRAVIGSWGLRPGANEVAFVADSYDAGAVLAVTYRSAWK